MRVHRWITECVKDKNCEKLLLGLASLGSILFSFVCRGHWPVDFLYVSHCSAIEQLYPCTEVLLRNNSTATACTPCRSYNLQGAKEKSPFLYTLVRLAKAERVCWLRVYLRTRTDYFPFDFFLLTLYARMCPWWVTLLKHLKQKRHYDDRAKREPVWIAKTDKKCRDWLWEKTRTSFNVILRDAWLWLMYLASIPSTQINEER